MCPSSVSHRGAVTLGRLLQVVIVGQDLHEEVQLQSLRLQDEKTYSAGRICTQASKNVRMQRQTSAGTDLWLFILHAPDAARTINDCIFWHNLTCIDLAAGTDDAATAQDHVSPEISWDFTSKKM